jgi:opacity protein-like surface antigen
MLPKMTVKRIAFGLVAAAIAAGFGEGTARAQYAAPPLPPPVFAWSGGYVGLNAGVAGGADAISETGVTTTGSGTMTAFGGTGGLAAGYNWQGISWLFGVEADVSYVGLHGSQDMSAANFSFITEHDFPNELAVHAMRARRLHLGQLAALHDRRRRNRRPQV